ncbi:MAG: hypothetical protein U0174_03070 [Polyangiaceae bacterium]
MRSGSVRTFAIALLLFLHGCAHASIGMTAQDKAHSFRFPMDGPGVVVIGTVLFAIAFTGFVAAAFALWGLKGAFPHWRKLTQVAAIASAFLIVLYAKSWTEASIGLALDVGLLVFSRRGSVSAPVFTGEKSETRFRRYAWRSTQAKGFILVPYLFILVVTRPYCRTWGSTAVQRSERLAGDEHAGDPERAGDRAVVIQAPADDVWPWLLQLGEDRGGFYSYASLENLFGLHIVNAERVDPKWQTLAAGDFVRAVPENWMRGVFGNRIGWEVDHVDAVHHVLALRYWVFHVETTSADTCVLHIRTHAGAPPVPIAPLLLTTFEPIHFVMERAMLRGIKERAEKLAEAHRATSSITDRPHAR